MRHLLLLAALALPVSASATPWFDQAGAETSVAQAFPDYFEYLQVIAEKNPDNYLEKLHQALCLTQQIGVHDELVDVWRKRWQAQQRFRERLEDWRAAPADSATRELLREDLILLSEELQAATQDLYRLQARVGEERLERLKYNLHDSQANFEELALERVMSALKE